MPYNLHGDAELARENLWARKQDAKALETIRRKIEAENEMEQNVAQLKAAPKA